MTTASIEVSSLDEHAVNDIDQVEDLLTPDLLEMAKACVRNAQEAGQESVDAFDHVIKMKANDLWASLQALFSTCENEEVFDIAEDYLEEEKGEGLGNKRP